MPELDLYIETTELKYISELKTEPPSFWIFRMLLWVRAPIACRGSADILDRDKHRGYGQTQLVSDWRDARLGTASWTNLFWHRGGILFLRKGFWYNLVKQEEKPIFKKSNSKFTDKHGSWMIVGFLSDSPGTLRDWAFQVWEWRQKLSAGNKIILIEIWKYFGVKATY